MKILYVCSGNFEGTFENSQVFIFEMIKFLEKFDIQYDIYLVKGKGLIGYLKALFGYWKKLLEKKYDVVHGIYVLRSFLACLRLNVPVITTFIGSDINNKKSRNFSRIAYRLSYQSIFVNDKLATKLNAKYNFSVIPFGVNTKIFRPIPQGKARKQLGYKKGEKIIVFSSSFNRPEKNFELAKRALNMINYNGEVLELGKNYSREKLNLIFNAVDLLLLTSLHEGSPQVIKEAMACNCPIVATNVGDIKELIGGTDGCFITSFESDNVAESIKKAIEFPKRTTGRAKIGHLDNEIIAKEIFDIYTKVAKK